MKPSIRINILRLLLTCLFFTLIQSSCKKDDILNAKPQTSLALPSSLSDLQAMLDLQSTMNLTPAMGDASADNYNITYTGLQSGTPQYFNLYTWASDIFNGQTNIADWNFPYSQVLQSNIVLEALNSISRTNGNSQNWDYIKGSAFFYRAYAFYNIAVLWAPLYDSVSASSDLGIPIRLTSDISEVSTRSSVKDTYNQILSDLSKARSLISINVPTNNKNRPSLPAIYGALAKLYLSVRNYSMASLYADSCLQIYNSLVDYNTVTKSTSLYLPFNYLNNPEVIYNTIQTANTASPASIINYLTSYGQASVDSTLYRSYNANDLRKTIFFYLNTSGTISKEGSYGASTSPFSGIAVNEMYLIRAECFARAGNMASAMADLNTLLSKRWKTGTFIPYAAVSVADALAQILTERRKELPFSSVRWTDLRRLNKEGYNITLTRIVNGQIYTLVPNDPKYTMPIPPDVIQQSGIQQNKR